MHDVYSKMINKLTLLGENEIKTIYAKGSKLLIDSANLHS